MKVKTGWVARDEDGGLKLHWEKPKRFERPLSGGLLHTGKAQPGRRRQQDGV